jgi:hypothetical protein
MINCYVSRLLNSQTYLSNYRVHHSTHNLLWGGKCSVVCVGVIFLKVDGFEGGLCYILVNNDITYQNVWDTIYKYDEIFLTDSHYLCFEPSYRNVISGCYHEVDENCALLLCHTVSSGNSLLTDCVIAQKSAVLSLATFDKTIFYLNVENCLWRFHVPAALLRKIEVLWDLMQCRMVHSYCQFRGVCCLHLQGLAGQEE